MEGNNLSQENIARKISQLKNNQNNNNNSLNKRQNGFPNALPQNNTQNLNSKENEEQTNSEEEVKEETSNQQNNFLGSSALDGLKNLGINQTEKVTDFAQKAVKAKKTISIIMAVAPVVLSMLIIIFLIICIMGQIMVVRDKIDKLASQFTTGIEKFVNFVQGEGWMTDEDSFFTYLNDQYNDFERFKSNGESLDIPLVAATIHYSKIVDLEKFEEADDSNDEEYKEEEFEEIGGFVSKEKTSSFYDIARKKLGSVSTIYPGQKRLLGHLANVKLEPGFYNYEAYKEYWSDFFKYALNVAKGTGMDIREELIDESLPVISFIKFYEELQGYVEQYGSYTYGMEYDLANNVYELDEFLHTLSTVYETAKTVSRDGSSDSGLWFSIKISTSMNTGYEEYQDLKQVTLEIKSALSKNNISFTSDEEAIEQAKNSSNSQIKSLYDKYEEINNNYKYSYTHYLQTLYIPYTYFYKQDYTSTQVNAIIEEIYAQRDFYNYIVVPENGGICTEGITSEDLAGLTREERLEILGPIAQLDYNRTGIFASVTLAQSILESNVGVSTPQKSNNIFGIKCGGNSWPSSKCVTAGTTEEYQQGVITNISAAFRAYDSIEESIADHSEFLLNNFPGIENSETAEKQIERLKGYATSSSYISNLKALVKQYDLTKWDVIVDASSSSLTCGPRSNTGWTIRNTVPTIENPAYNYVTANRGQCVWYAQARAIEIAEELNQKGKLSNEDLNKIKDYLLNQFPGNAEAWYRNGKNKFRRSSSIKAIKAGSIIVWNGGSNMCDPACGHIAVIEEVTNTTVTFSDGWATNGYSCPDSWNCVNQRTETMPLEDFYREALNNFGSHNGTMSFVGYVHFLEPL